MYKYNYCNLQCYNNYTCTSLLLLVLLHLHDFLWHCVVIISVCASCDHFTGLPCKLPMPRKMLLLKREEGEGEEGKGRGSNAVTLRAVVRVTVIVVKTSGSRGRRRPENDLEAKVLQWGLWFWCLKSCYTMTLCVSDCQLHRRLLLWISSPNGKYSLQ